MKLIDREKLAVLLAAHLCWGWVLWFSISKYGLGVSTDSVDLLFGGLNFARQQALISFDGSFLVLWPPLYPVLLAIVHLISGADVFMSAKLLQFAAFIGLSLCLSILFLNIFKDHFLLALAAGILADVGAVVLVSFDEVGSDYLHLLLVMLCVLLTGAYLEHRSRRTFVALSLVGMLAMLDRYLGVAAIATAAAAVTLFVAGTIWQRLARGLVVCLTALPAGIWWVITSQMYARREPISFAENFQWFSRSILEWLFPFKTLRPHLDSYIFWLWILMLGLLVAVIWTGRRRAARTPALSRRSQSFAVPLILFGACYTLALFGAASVSYSNKLRGRFLLPVYIPAVALLTMAAEIPLRATEETRSNGVRLIARGFSYGTLAVAGLLLLRVTVPLVLESHGNGAAGGDNAFNTKEWQENQAVQYWLSHPPGDPYMLLSNEPDGVAFYSRHATGSVPRKTTGPYGTQQYALDEYTADLFASGLEVYVLWKEPNFYDYLYSVDELQAIAQIETLFRSEQGGVYRLRPKAGS